MITQERLCTLPRFESETLELDLHEVSKLFENSIAKSSFELTKHETTAL